MKITHLLMKITHEDKTHLRNRKQNRFEKLPAITAISVLCQILEFITLKKLTNYYLKQDIFNQTQYGFIPSRSKT